MTERHLITSALPYVSATKHLGNLAGSLLPADVRARHLRQRGREVLFVCATDEHGTPTEIAAAAAGVDPRTFCDRGHADQAETFRSFGLSFDHFGRTSSRANHALTQHLYRCLDGQGLIEERTVSQVYSPRDARFLPDRYVLGTCPRCGDPGARGDQCEACGSLLDATDLLDPRSAVSGDAALEVRDTRHLFLRQSALASRLRDWLSTREGWAPSLLALARSQTGPDLRDRCITRDLSWGVPVPRPGFEGKSFYVWFDAPIGYLAAVVDWAAAAEGRDWQRWVHGEVSSEVAWEQHLGKDNAIFHCVNFPATLLGSGEPWKTADRVKAFNWLTYEGGKFSTSSQRGIFLDRALDVAPADLWRWWLTANAPESADVDLDPARFADDVNKDLADVLGNLVQRTTALAHKAHGRVVPEGGDPTECDEAVAREAAAIVLAIARHFDALEFRAAAAAVRSLWVRANAYLQQSAPWTVARTDPVRAATILRVALNLARLSAVVAWPIIPTLASEALSRLGETIDPRRGPAWPDDARGSVLDGLPPGTPLTLGVPLVAKVTPEAASAAGRARGATSGSAVA